MVKRYRKLPVVIQAIQFTGENIHGIMSWIEDSTDKHNCHTLAFDPDENAFFVLTLEGRMRLSEGDYLICGIKGEFYPCKPDIFEATYVEAASDR